MTKDSSTNTVTSRLIAEIKEALESVKFGSIEIFIQNRVVTQITVRNIHKTSVEIEKEKVKISTHKTNPDSRTETQTHTHKDSVKIL